MGNIISKEITRALKAANIETAALKNITEDGYLELVMRSSGEPRDIVPVGDYRFLVTRNEGCEVIGEFTSKRLWLMLKQRKEWVELNDVDMIKCFHQNR